MDKEPIFLRWVREGRIEFTEDGKIIAFNETYYSIAIPAADIKIFYPH